MTIVIQPDDGSTTRARCRFDRPPGGTARRLSCIWRCAVLSLFCVAVPILRAADPFSSARPAISFWGSDTRFARTTAYSPYRDSHDRIWIGTVTGPAYLEGDTFHGFPLPAEAGLTGIRAIQETRDGSMWFGGDSGGLWQYSGQRWIHHTRATGLASDGINTLLETIGTDGRGVLWVGTRGGGVSRLQDGRWESFGEGAGLPDSYVWRLREVPARDGRGEVWAATKKGIGVFRGGRWVNFGALTGMPREISEVNDIVPDPGSKSGAIWASCWGVGLAYWDGARWSIAGPAQGFQSRNPTYLAVSSPAGGGASIIWAGTYDQGLLWRNELGWQRFAADQGLPASGIYGLLSNPGGYPDLWIAARGSGLMSVDLSAWRTVDNRQGLPVSEITCFGAVAGDPVSLWIGTSGGLAQWNGAQWELTALPADMRNSRILAVEAANRPQPGVLWVGTLRGLLVRDGGRWRRLGAAEGLPETRVRAMIQIPHADGPEVWVAFESGQARFRAGNWTFYRSGLDIPDEITGMAVVSRPGGDPVLWAVTIDGQVWRRREEKWEADATVGNRQINVIKASSPAAGPPILWAGGKDGTLWRLAAQTGAKWESFALPATLDAGGRTIWSIEQDRNQLLLATNQAYLRAPIDPATDRPVMGRAVFDSHREGLPARGQLTVPGLSLTDVRGRVWFGTPSGAVVLDPATASPLPPLPPVRFTSIVADGRELPRGLRAEFPHRVKRLDLTFVLPFYNRIDSVRYQSQLIGLEDEPEPWHQENFRKISTLRPGSYVLRILARDHAGRISLPAEFAFSIASPPWLTWWAYAAYAWLIAAAIYAAIRWRSHALTQEKHALEVAVSERTEELRRKNEELAVARDSALQATNAKSEFLANMSHEIRTPMNGVIGLTEVLLESNPDPGQLYALNAIKDSGNTLLALINDILDLSKLEAGKLSLESTVFDLPGLIGSVLRNLGAVAFGNGLELACDLQPGVPEMVSGDPLRLRQVLTNLVGNAIKFTTQGEVVVQIRLESPGGGPNVHFSVSDTGIGIPPAKVERIFDAFGQADASTTRRYGGTGLGLTISARLVAMMGGRIWLESTEGLGTTFHFTAPLPAVTGGSGATGKSGQTALQGCRVLLADRSGAGRNIVEKTLRQWSMAVETATNGAATIEALERAARTGQPFQVLIIDNRLPDCAPADLVKRIWRMPQYAGLPVVLLAVDERGEAMGETGALQVVYKPVQARELGIALEAALAPADDNSQTPDGTERRARQPVAPPGGPKRPGRILLAEDNAVNQMVARGMLRQLGYDSIDTVANGVQAIEMLSRTDYDLVLMDCQMPELDGYETTRLIRSETSTVRNHRIAIVAMTAHAMPEDRSKCLEAGMDDYVAKPLSRDSLRRLVDRWVGAGRACEGVSDSPTS